MTRSAHALLRQARREGGLTQGELARRLGKTQATVASLERVGANPTVETLTEALQATGHRLELSAAPYRPSIDETLIASNMRRSPAERLAAFGSSYRSMKRMVESVRSADGGLA